MEMYNIYCDESCHLEHDHLPIMALGAIWCPESDHIRLKGKPIPTNDLWIAATTLQQGYKLCSFDAHFSVVKNLIIATTLDEFLF